jgi:ADP-heptose:LPS heptosyltransferase
MRVQASSMLPDVRKIVALVPNAVGDFVFALPALHALGSTYPHAELTLVARDWHRDLLHGRPGPVDRVLVMPPCPGVGLAPDAPCDRPALQDFLDGIRAERFDLAVQMFGGGRYSNPLVRAFGARLSVGPRTDDAPLLDRWVRYSLPNNRRLALLEVVALAGARWPEVGNELAVTDADRKTAYDALALASGQWQPVSLADGDAVPALSSLFGGRPLAVLQPGSTDPRRCWPAECFAAVGDALERAGAVVAINGSDAEAPLVRAVLGHMRRPALDLGGRLSLAGLCGLLDGAALLVSNDTGPLHLSLAVGTPGVGIFWFTNLVDGTPLRQHLLHAAVSVRLRCPVCGVENVRERCAHDPSFVADVPVAQVTSMATSLLRAVR